MIKARILCAAIIATLIPTIATAYEGYHVKIPIRNWVSSSAEDGQGLTIHFSGAEASQSTPTVVNGEVGALLTLDLRDQIVITGETSPDYNEVVWTVVSPLPNGFSLSPAGVLSGTPTESGSHSFEIKATYKTAEDTQGFTFNITAEQIIAAKVLAAADHACLITTVGAVKCWGDNYSGHLGDGTFERRYSPTNVIGVSGSALSFTNSEAFHTCVVTDGDAVYCWGANWAGQVGDGTTQDRNTAIKVPGLPSQIKQVASGTGATCILTNAGEVKCWGSNYYGELGDGTNTDRLTPATVTNLSSGVEKITGGDSNFCAIMTGGELRCWGRNEYGQLGLGTATHRKTPAIVMSGVKDVSMAAFHACALKTDNTVHCWGYGGDGGLGIGNRTTYHTPQPVTSLSGAVASLHLGSGNSCALLTSGALWCWGDNSAQQLADGTNTRKLTPIKIAGLDDQVKTMAVGGNFMCAVKQDSTVWCWGENEQGQINDQGEDYIGTPTKMGG